MKKDCATVLLVDDDPVVRFLATEALEGAGFTVNAVATGPEALVRLATTEPDLVILDVMLGEQDGCALCTTMRNHPNATETPILMMTTLDDDTTIDRVYDAGATDFVSKPVPPTLLVHRVRYLLRASAIRRDARVTANKLREAESRALELAFFDPLTALANRRLLLRYLGSAVDRAVENTSSVAVLTVDLDGFKRVNDTLGHPAGDSLLRAVARRIGACIGGVGSSEQGASLLSRHLESDVLAARTGGDEFVLVFRDPGDLSAISATAERINRAVAESYEILGNEVTISSSIGIARFPGDARDPGLLLERADAALYRAKDGGRNTYRHFTADLIEKARRKIELENGLRRALVADAASSNTHLFLEYQPKVRLPEGRVVGVEALVRLRLDGAVVSPMDFIPIAEETGLIVPVGDWVLREACEQARTWMAIMENPLSVAVNVSARQLQGGTFARSVVRVLEDTGLPVQLLELEVTESTVLAAAGVEIVSALKSLGVKISLDDFGTGYSSLSYLMKLPIDTLKIDRSFVREITRQERTRTITAAIMNLATSLGINVVVEGVETQEQLAILLPLGPLDIQGYYFARPMRADDVLPWKDRFVAERSKPASLSIAA